jgi:uncharacterized protein (DUF1015 family)
VPELLNDVRPFKGLTFDPALVKSVGECLCQPYDVISEQQQEGYYRRNPWNAIRLVLGRRGPGDDERNNRYTRSRQTLAAWRDSRVLRLAPRPALWIYRQTYTANDQRITTTGVIAAVRLSDFAERRVLPHEKVMPKPVEDRYRLTVETACQMEPIWCFYFDPTSTVSELGFERTDPLVRHLESETGVEHTVWMVDDPHTTAALTRSISARPIYIADGHHRYHTMLQVREAMHRAHGDGEEEAPWNFMMMLLYNAGSETQTVLAYHRVVAGLDIETEEVLRRLERNFTLTFFDDDRRWRSAIKDGLCGMAVSGSSRRYVLSNRAKDGRLDVEILNDSVLGEGLGISEAEIAAQTYLDYSHDADEALNHLDEGQARFVFLMNPTPLEAIVERADGGGIMPRKSSFFYPKPLSGTVFYPLES